MTEKNTPCLEELSLYFGKEIIKEDGTLDRRRLANIAFSTPEKHNALNSITHRHILLLLEEKLLTAEKRGYFAAVIDAPLLFESGLDKRCDVIVAVTAPYDVRIQRITARDKITAEEAELRFKRQIDEKELKERSHYVIYNDDDEAQLERKVLEVVSKIGEKP